MSGQSVWAVSVSRREIEFVSGSSFRLILLDVAPFYGHTCSVSTRAGVPLGYGHTCGVSTRAGVPLGYGHTCGVSTRAGVPLGCSLGRAQAADSELLATDADRRHQDAGTGKLTSYCPFCKYTLTTLVIRRARA